MIARFKAASAAGSAATERLSVFVICRRHRGWPRPLSNYIYGFGAVVRAGSTLGGADLIPQTTLDTGTPSLAFTQGSANLCIQIETTDAWAKTLTSCATEAAGPLVLPTP